MLTHHALFHIDHVFTPGAVAGSAKKKTLDIPTLESELPSLRPCKCWNPTAQSNLHGRNEVGAEKTRNYTRERRRAGCFAF